MKRIAIHIAAVGGLIACLACGYQSDGIRTSPPPTPIQTADERVTSWQTDPTAESDNEPLKRAWKQLERSQNYRLAQFSDRNLTAAAAARVKSNNSNQIKPSLIWWGARGYRGHEKHYFLQVYSGDTTGDVNSLVPLFQCSRQVDVHSHIPASVLDDVHIPVSVLDRVYRVDVHIPASVQDRVYRVDVRRVQS